MIQIIIIRELLTSYYGLGESSCQLVSAATALYSSIIACFTRFDCLLQLMAIIVG